MTRFLLAKLHQNNINLNLRTKLLPPPLTFSVLCELLRTLQLKGSIKYNHRLMEAHQLYQCSDLNQQRLQEATPVPPHLNRIPSLFHPLTWPPHICHGPRMHKELPLPLLPLRSLHILAHLFHLPLAAVPLLRAAVLLQVLKPYHPLRT